MGLADAPHVSRVFQVEKDWIDYNGHMNMAYYTVLFDLASDEISEMLGMGPEYARSRGLTTYTAEIHLRYIREMRLGDEAKATYQLLDYDEKRLHAFQELYHVDGWLAASCEVMTLHVDMSGPKVAPFPPDVMEKVTMLAGAHAQLPQPEHAGRSIAIRRRS